MKRNQSKECIFNRLSLKDLDHQFQQEVERGLNCSPFESKLLVQTVHETYFSVLSHPENIKPGQMRLQAISEDEPAGRPLSQCLFKTITITLEHPDDIKIRKEQGINGLRQHKILRITHESLAQGTLLTVEDLSYRIFNVGYRTIVRDIKVLSKSDIVVPLRSTQKDIGRSITHKEQIIKLWLSGYEYSEIAIRTQHSLDAIQRYINLFKRAIALREDGYSLINCTFLLKSSPKLIQSYWNIFEKYQTQGLSSRLKELKEFILKKTLREEEIIL